jgi:phosphatidylinositol alpha-1,6-mannosyltransferase
VRTLVVTNDFPPRPGGIQAFVHSLASRLPADEVVVYAPAWKRAAAFDTAQAFPVVRHPTSLMLPVPDVLRRARDIAAAEGCDRVWFGAAAPLGLLARSLGLERSVASTHGHEVGWALLPGARQVLRRIGRDVDVVTYLGEYTRARLAPVVPRLERLPSGVDPSLFHPGAGGEAVRARHGLADRRVIVCVSRLVPRKGQDVLIRALPEIQRRVPDAALLIVGGGPYLSALQKMAGPDVTLTGSVPWEELPAHYDAGDVFAMPCRTRLLGLEPEAWGIVFLEAQACGLPVVIGRSGGAPEALLDGAEGRVVSDPADVRDALVRMLGAPRRSGELRRSFVSAEQDWNAVAARLRGLLC